MNGVKGRDPNPLQNANVLSSATFYYTLPTFTHTKRTKRLFEEDDLYETLTEHQSEILGNKIETLWKKQLKKQKKPSLTRVLISAFGFEFFILGLILGVLELIIKPAQAVLLGRFLVYYLFTADDDANLEARFYAGGIVLLSLFYVLCLHPVLLRLKTVGLKVKIACCSLIYRKALKLNQEAFVNTNVGQIVNLIASDAPMFIMVGMQLNYLWAAPLQCIIVTYLMYQEVGVSSILGVAVLFLLIPIHHLLSKAASKYQWKSSSRTDDRVRYMDEIILGIKIIKMCVWEKMIKTVLLSMRNFEIKYIRLSMYLKSVNVSFDSLLIPVVLYVSIISYALHNDVNPDKVFTLMIFYNSLRGSMASAFPSAIGYRALAIVAIRRMEQFLFQPEVALETMESTTDPISIKIIDGDAKWSETSTLQKINLTVKPGNLVIVTGPVGCGKSSLLNVMLNELRLISGKIQINGQVSYASQDAWLFGGTIRDNILLGEQIELKRYNEVVRVCALEDDFALFPLGDHELVGGRGTSLSGGQKSRINLARAIYRDADIYLLDEPFAAVDAHVSKQIFQECIKRFLAKKTVVLVTHQQQYLKDADEIITMENGTIISQVPWTENNGLGCSNDQDNIDRTVKEDDYYNLSKGAVDNTKDIAIEQTSVGAVSYTVYKKYAIANGFLNFAILTVLFLLTQVLLSSGPYFLTHWVNKAQIGEISTNASDPSQVLVHSKTMHIYIYSALTFACVVVVPLRSCLFFFSVLKSSQKLHNNMFNSVIGATMNFFNTNSPGRIINRFSQDVGAVDSKLPYVLVTTTHLLLEAFAAVMLISIVNYWLLLPAVIMAIIAYYIKMFCLLTSRHLKRLEGVTRSSVFEHLSSSLQGLSTIRALQSETVLKEKFNAHQDVHSCCHHLFLSTSHAFGYFIDCMCSLYVAIVTLSFVIYDNGSLSGDVGLAITQSMSLIAYLQYAMQQTAELENNMTSVERILEYDAIEQEDKCNTEPLKTWPKSGGILFRNLSLKYSPLGPSILKNLNFEISPREKIGIIGRTGAGKSSIVNALLRLSYTSGDILIDNVDIKTLNMQAVRSKISVIPQDPTLFSGTLRQNLDPFEEYNDDVLWKSLEEVELKGFFESQPQGLLHVIVQGGINISVGQRQLICLSRAILRNNNILIMDEATANIDLETDNLIQRTIKKKFENCTVLTIAHRLQTVLDSDRILVMNDGEVVEFDKPSVLLNNTNGYFYKIVQQMNNNDT